MDTKIKLEKLEKLKRYINKSSKTEAKSKEEELVQCFNPLDPVLELCRVRSFCLSARTRQK
jgi:hypothetical protein